MVIGERLRQNYYAAGSCCPLEWLPSPLSAVMSRADYFAWHQGLVRLAETLELEKFTALPPKAPAAPWVENDEPAPHVIPGRDDGGEYGMLPLRPLRPRAGPPRRQSQDVHRQLKAANLDSTPSRESLT